LLDPKFVAAESELRELETAARAAGREIVVVRPATESEIEAAASVIAQSEAAGWWWEPVRSSSGIAGSSSRSQPGSPFPQLMCNASSRWTAG
jgi:hypothetical protein